jgi:hypothetical protein
MANRIQLRRGSAQEWANVNPTLAIGELGIEIDTGRIKIGDGITAWNSLRYERPVESVTNAPNTLIQRDADGNFQAGAITGSLIGNASTATRLANTRQIAISGDVTASATFDGSANLNLASALQIIQSLPHYDGSINSTGTYTKVTVDAKGRIINASNPTTIQEYGLAGTVEGQSAQSFDRDLQGVADLTTTGIITRVSDGNIVTRTIQGTSGRIAVTNGSGVAGNPSLDLIPTTIQQGTYNTPTIAGATQTIRATRFTVDAFGRFTYAEDFPIATAVEGTTSSAWSTGVLYARYAKVTSSGRLYQAVNAGTSGATAPSHTSGDASDGTVLWRHLGLVTTRQKGLASFDQEDFDVDGDGHVRIADKAVDNTQLQNTEIRFADGSGFTAYELDNELTASTGYRGITTINDLSVNDTAGNPLIRSINSNNPATSNVDINTVTANIFSDITLDKTSTAVQTINRAGSLTLLMDASTASNRFLRILAQNAGTGEGKMEIIADHSILFESSNSTISITSPQQISLISSSADVRIEDIYFANNVISSTNSTIVLDPAGVGDNTGTVQVKGNLLVDGTTITVNSETMTVDDPVITLGGDTAPITNDGRDRGVEFRYYDTQARLGFYGWDSDYSTLAGTTGGYRFLYNATNTSEVFSGIDAGIIAGNLALSSNVGSTSTTTGTLVVTGGAGISQNLWIGGTANVAGNSTLQGTLGVTGNTTLNSNVTLIGSNTAATELFKIQNGSGTDKFVVDSSSGNTTIEGTLNLTDNAVLNRNVTIVGSNTAATEFFKIQNASAVDRFVVDSSSGNTTISGTLGVSSATTLSSTLDVTGATTLTGNLTTQGSSLVHLQNTDAPTIVTDENNNYIISGGDYGTFRNDGGGYFGKDVLFAQDVYVNGAINVKDAGDTGVSSRINGLEVRYRTILGFTTAYTPSFATDTNSNARITGGAGIATSLHIGGTAASQGLFVGKRISSDTVKFSVLGASGNTSISGTLGVAGITSITNATDSSATNNGALVITGGVGIGAQLRVAGNTTLTGDLAVNGGDLTTTASTFNLLASPTTVNFAAAGTAVNIGATTGTCTIRNANTVITGNLTVNGTTTTVNATTITVDDPVLTLGGDTAPSSDDNKDRGIEFRYFDVSAKLGFFGWDDSSSGYRFLENATNSSEVFSGTDARLFAGRIDLSSNVGSTSTTTGTLVITGGTGISQNLNVGGTTTLTGLLDANGGATIDNIRIGIANDNEIDTSTGNLVIDSAGGTTTIDDILSVSGITTITNATSRTIPSGASIPALAGALQVTGGAHVGENFVVNGDLKVYGAAVYQGGIDYQGTQTYSGIIRQTNTSDASSSTDTTASISTAGGVAIAKRLFVGNNTSIAGTLGVSGATILSSTLSVTGLITANAGLTISGSAGAGEDFIITDGTTTRFTVASSNGNTSTSGTLSVSGTSIFTGVITANGGVVGALTGNASTATTLQTARTIGISGDGTGTATSFNGSANITIPFTLANTGVGAGTYRSVTVDTKGRVSAGTNPTTIAEYGLTDAQPLDSDLTAIAGLTTNGLITRTSTGAAATRSIAVSGIGISVSNADGVSGDPTITSNATPNNSANAIVARDASRNFTANVITASLSGNASTATTLQTARTIAGVSFDGSANINIPYANLTSIPSAFTADRLANTTPPATATATGTAGEVRYDSDYIYICVATNTWKRVTIDTW